MNSVKEKLKSAIKSNEMVYSIARLCKKYFILVKLRISNPSLIQYRNQNGEERRYDYSQLSEDSVVFDCGGYHGDFSAKIYNKYFCNCYVFEPVREYYDTIIGRFRNNDKIHVYNFGLDAKGYFSNISLSEDGSSLLKKFENTKEELCEVKSITEFMKEERIEKVDLLKINIEGGEYGLLEGLIASGDIERFDNIQVQFHNIEKRSKERMRMLWAQLEKTHTVEWAYRPFVWESWHLTR